MKTVMYGRYWEVGNNVQVGRETREEGEQRHGRIKKNKI